MTFDDPSPQTRLSESDLIEVRKSVPDAISLGSDHRNRQILRRLKTAARRAGAIEVTIDGSDIICTFPSKEKADQSGRAFAEILDAAESDRVPPKVLEEALMISSKERSAWTKAGLIRTSGHEVFHSGRQAIRVPLYASAEVRRLRQDFSQVELWRASTL
ncbi:MAG: hypothetical protein GX970_06485 [Phyllobacteriaceae bacterium]|nr:hypothetical protein [Phyllobacteriaceae bacterium]